MLAANHLGIAPEHVRVIRAPSGAPRIEAPGRALRVSLAHRDDVLLVGLAGRPIGVDIERIDAVRQPPWNVLAEAERKALVAIEDRAARHAAFLRIWTAKEAALKALGTGLSREPATLAVTFDGDMIRLHDRAKALETTVACVELSDHGSDRFVWACVVL